MQRVQIDLFRVSLLSSLRCQLALLVVVVVDTTLKQIVLLTIVELFWFLCGAFCQQQHKAELPWQNERLHIHMWDSCSKNVPSHHPVRHVYLDVWKTQDYIT